MSNIDFKELFNNWQHCLKFNIANVTNWVHRFTLQLREERNQF